MTTLMFHRHSLKAFAVLNMILNHISYSFFPEHSFGRIAGTLPADLVGSAQIFFFLVGYQYHDKKQASIVPRSGNAKILIVFLLLEQFSPPLAFHTLFTIYIARSLISRPEFSPKDGAPDRSFFSEMHPFAHAFFCTLLVGTNQFFNAEGIRMVENASIMYAVAGRLFGAGLADIEGHTSTGTAKEIARTRSWCASLIWLSAAWSWQLKKIWISVLSNLELKSTLAVFAIIYFVGSVFQLFVLAVPVEQSLCKPSRFSALLSKWSLEIYVGHFALLWIFYGS